MNEQIKAAVKRAKAEPSRRAWEDPPMPAGQIRADGVVLAEEVERLQAALRAVQWKTMPGRMGTSAYPTCVGCGAKSHGALSAPQHSPDCKIENALCPKTKGKAAEAAQAAQAGKESD